MKEPWDIVYYKAPGGSVPFDAFLTDCPDQVEASILATLEAVAEAPPPQFSGGGKWEAMHGSMGGYYELRVSGPKREQFRAFCVLENGTTAELARRGLRRPTISVITGLRKPWMQKFTDSDYQKVRSLGTAHRACFPRNIAT